jgi:hypothetical protein
MPALPPFNSPYKRGEGPSKFDRHYNTRLNKRWRDVCLSLAGVMLLVVVLIALDPVVSGSAPSPRALIFFSFLFLVFLIFSLSFHLRYKSRE